jgi:hypothetical protein
MQRKVNGTSHLECFVAMKLDEALQGSSLTGGAWNWQYIFI